ncbi:Predicted nuclease of the RNAse H fold, HicB family [Sphingomonas laterariae]|uniref:Predicted nuclease of the RNAse H fold, HicB family n=1 Tax=Edaphosphingomonas laterariae TaxID=861865 RepID=A0A239F782_9SPHN|nr:type II toxin-antitoxin system HicB family antitoxin [Sphingomonas laterariae]SNS52789.1 Predicted nuclease of the RNAse H fold, HicB family [Sphingomonas laterariae]
MATVYYPAIIERAGDTFSVFFPDLKGLASAGDTIHEAAIAAEEALGVHLLAMAEHKEDIPAPSELDAIEADPEVDEAIRILVRGERPGRAVRLNITLDEGLVAAIDRVAGNRSRFLADAARVALAGRAL